MTWAMTAPSWPPDDRHPIEEWTDHELIDQYRYVKAELAAEDRDHLESDDSALASLISEIIRRGLDDLAEAVEDNPAGAGREAR